MICYVLCNFGVMLGTSLSLPLFSGGEALLLADAALIGVFAVGLPDRAAIHGYASCGKAYESDAAKTILQEALTEKRNLP